MSRQQHYDWGLRALKSVLRSAGDGLRASQENSNSTNDEHSVIVRALTFNTLSKLTKTDANLFIGLVSDIFPAAKFNLQDARQERLIKIIATCCEDMGLILLQQQVGYIFLLLKHIGNVEYNVRCVDFIPNVKVKKVLEVYEQIKQRIGVVVVGPPQTGKSTVCAILKRVSDILEERHSNLTSIFKRFFSPAFAEGES